jgi:hypothetical protein
VPGQPLPGALHEQQADDPERGDQHDVGRQAQQHEAVGQLAAGDDDRQHGDHDDRLEHEGERRRPVGERRHPLPPPAEDVEDDEHHGLDRDAAEDVADRDRHVARQGRADRDRDLGQVRRDGEHDQPAEGAADVQPVVEHVGGLRQLDAGDPGDGGRGDEDDDQEPEREGVHRARQLLRAGRRPGSTLARRSPRGAAAQPSWSSSPPGRAAPGAEAPSLKKSA